MEPITAQEYHDRDTAERNERIDWLKAGAPEGATFMGFGGSSLRHETLVFDYMGREIRFPVMLEFHPLNVLSETGGWGSFGQIEEAYGCLAFGEWYEVIERFADDEPPTMLYA